MGSISEAFGDEKRLPKGDMTQKLPKLVEPITKVFTSVAFIMITGSLIFAMRDADGPQNTTKTIATFLVLTACVGVTQKLSTTCLDLANGITAATGLHTPEQIADSAIDYAKVFNKLNNEVQTPTKENQGTVSEFLAPLKGFFQGLLNTPIAGIKAITLIFTLKMWLKEIVIIIGGCFLSVLLWVSGLVIEVLETIRTFLFLAGASILPVFIAGLGSKTYRSQSLTYILGLVGIACWPLGWAIGHVGTVVLFDWAVEWSASLGGPLTLLQKMGQGTEITKVEGMQSLAAYIASLGGGWMTYLVWLIIPWIIVAIWILLVTISGPLIVQKVVAGGAQFFSPLAAGTATMTQQAMQAAIEKAVQVASVAAAAATGGASMAAAGATSGAGGASGMLSGELSGAFGGSGGGSGGLFSSLSGELGATGDKGGGAGKKAMAAGRDFALDTVDGDSGGEGSTSRTATVSASVSIQGGSKSTSGSGSSISVTGGGDDSGNDILSEQMASIQRNIARMSQHYRRS
ncbi:MAG: hypothetical protein SGI71_11000 [Verrucomicrobiota bacterium]|nr:hypothetical protein [Verrucomicrobiota bacterium]